MRTWPFAGVRCQDFPTNNSSSLEMMNSCKESHCHGYRSVEGRANVERMQAPRAGLMVNVHVPCKSKSEQKSAYLNKRTRRKLSLRYSFLTKNFAKTSLCNSHISSDVVAFLIDQNIQMNYLSRSRRSLRQFPSCCLHKAICFPANCIAKCYELMPSCSLISAKQSPCEEWRRSVLGELRTKPNGSEVSQSDYSADVLHMKSLQCVRSAAVRARAVLRVFA